MASLIPNLVELNDLAMSSGMDYWLTQGINIILSTIVGGILLILVMAIFNKKYGGQTQPGKIFFVVLIINTLTFFGVFGILLSILIGVPLAGFLIPIIIWAIVLTLAFPDMHFIHNVVIAIIFVLLTITLVPFINTLIIGAI